LACGFHHDLSVWAECPGDKRLVFPRRTQSDWFRSPARSPESDRPQR
jgi:hypothetical protein